MSIKILEKDWTHKKTKVDYSQKKQEELSKKVFSLQNSIKFGRITASSQSSLPQKWLSMSEYDGTRKWSWDCCKFDNDSHGCTCKRTPPAKVDLNKKWLPKQKTIQNFSIDAQGFGKTRNENTPTQEIGVTS